MDRVQNQSKVSMFIQRYYPTIELTLGDIGFMTLGPGVINKKGKKKKDPIKLQRSLNRGVSGSQLSQPHIQTFKGRAKPSLLSIINSLIFSCMLCKVFQVNRLYKINRLETLDKIKEFKCIWFDTLHGLFIAGQVRQDTYKNKMTS